MYLHYEVLLNYIKQLLSIAFAPLYSAVAAAANDDVA